MSICLFWIKQRSSSNNVQVQAAISCSNFRNFKPGRALLKSLVRRTSDCSRRQTPRYIKHDISGIRLHITFTVIQRTWHAISHQKDVSEQRAHKKESRNIFLRNISINQCSRYPSALLGKGFIIFCAVTKTLADALPFLR